jgi:hypothetical protein
MNNQPTIDHVSGKYGAPMGRVSWRGRPQSPVRLFRVPLDQGGYDTGGAYWGNRRTSESLYCATDGDNYRLFIDAPCRDDAVRQVTADLVSLGCDDFRFAQRTRNSN